MTEDNLKAAFAGESQAHMKYLIFADKAEQEGYPNVAKLFRAIAYAELVHARNHLKELNGVGNTTDNLQTGINGETYEIEEMYPAFKAVAELQGEKKAILTFNWALESEKEHQVMYTNAKKTVESGKDLEDKPVYVCEICGYTVIGDAPDKCPVCGAPVGKFKKF